ncbi:gfo/Idh/MocA family oxidoreductase [Paenibacillus psychroresistens]|uniref:Gfo/Idh/MocA family oxidoreductase n=1 Tax=Paenibacillus psychroresistens TaxID=1778678 RepID=A0A6B8RNT1_9BACL|nr:Gfo/Idh/MocA family oxidoreductase [Paenibacillus psychroresistens]QGQ97193.1 gfo/Idh/MocA family oxidoreductase [Paenibacillus psychroresistens]
MGVIGLAGIANFHIKGILESQDAELWAISDVNEVTLKMKAEEYHIPDSRSYTNYSEMLKHSGIDALSICTPNFNHFEIAFAAIEHGIPFAVEKPVALNTHEADILNRRVQETKLPNMVCFSYRYKAAARYAKWLVEQGSLGRITHVYSQYLQGWAINEQIPLIWRFQKSLSGSGALGDLGSHILDLTRFLVGDAEKIFSHAGTLVKERTIIDSQELGQVDVDDFCHWMALYAGNISVTAAISRFAYGRGNYQRIEIFGTEGSLIYNLDEDDTLEVCMPGENGHSNGFNKVAIPDNFKSDQMQSFFDIVNGKSDGLSATMQDGLINQKSLDAIIESFTAGTWVSLQ